MSSRVWPVAPTEFLPSNGSKLFSGFKNYYEILQVRPDSRARDITVSYSRLACLYNASLSDTAKGSPLFSKLISDTREAYQVLSDPVRRRAYDRFYYASHISTAPVMNRNLSQSRALPMSPIKAHESRGTSTWVGSLRRGALTAIASILVMLTAGTSIAMAKPESAVSAPFKGLAIAVLRSSSEAIALIEEVRGVAAGYERNIVQTSVASMRVIENVRDTSVVSAPTSDLANFPSPEHPLYPDFLDKRYSQFSYTIDNDGIVTVHIVSTNPDSFLGRIKQLLIQLEE